LARRSRNQPVRALSSSSLSGSISGSSALIAATCLWRLLT